VAYTGLAQKAYQRAMIATAGPRSIEADAFERINGELLCAARRQIQDYPSIVKALSRNLSLWTILAADVAQDANALPDETRTMIWKIAAFVRQRTHFLLQPGAEIEISALIDLNAAMIAGLQAKPAGAAP
jgi:flagellar protein FlaF